jgi:anaerobic selenocysteine-containing dehydrogenase
VAEELKTYCRICEPLCGMVATVEDGELVQLRPDKDHPLSKGFACPKGIAFAEVHNDPDRVLHPLRKNASGEFEQVGWEEALDDIAKRLGAVRAEHGGNSIGGYFGNPSAFNMAHTLWFPAFMKAIGSRNIYSAGSQDVNNRFVASELLYGSPITAPIPDLARTDLLVIIGANPLVSHGSVMSAPRIKEELHGITDRGGRVVVVDPRRSETAREFEWLPVNPDGDAWLLLSLLHVLFEDGLADQGALAEQARGADDLRRLAAPFAPEETEAHHGIPAADVRKLAEDLANTKRAAVYGRTGTCLGRSGTLTTFLLDAVNVVAGNLDRVGGAMFGTLGAPGERRATKAALGGILKTGAARSRIGGFPSVLATMPGALMAKEMTTPGEGQIRALILSAGNPVLSVPNGDELEAALDGLDFFVAMDLYVNETNAHADYVLPATTMYERDDFPIAFQTLFTTPFRQATRAVVPPRGEAREEWTVLEEVMRRMPEGPRRVRAFQVGRRLFGPLAKAAMSPMRVADNIVRMGKGGDRFGLKRGGLNLKKLLDEHPSGVIVDDHLQPGALGTIAWHDDRKVHLDAPGIAEEIERLNERPADPDFPLSLIGMRELRSENSWMHNSPLLQRGGRVQTARIHPADAEAIGVADGARVAVISPNGRIELPALLTDEVKQGVVAIPHGWGHKGSGSWRTANSSGAGKSDGNGNGKPVPGTEGGVNINLLMSTEVEDVEPLAGMAHLNGVPIRLEAVAADGSAGGDAETEAPEPATV